MITEVNGQYVLENVTHTRLHTVTAKIYIDPAISVKLARDSEMLLDQYNNVVGKRHMSFFSDGMYEVKYHVTCKHVTVWQ